MVLARHHQIMVDDGLPPACLRLPGDQRPAPAPVEPPPPPAASPARPQFADDAELRREADRQWREWTPSRHETSRPQLRSILKRLRDQQKAAKEAELAKRGTKELQTQQLGQQRKATKTQAASAPAKPEAAPAAPTPPPAKPEAETTEDTMTTKTTSKSKKASKAKARTPVKAKTKAASGARARYDWKTAEEKAAAGTLATPPDFSAPTHKPYASKIEEVLKAARAGDKEALAKIKIKPVSSTPKALDRYRKLAITAIENKKAA